MKKIKILGVSFDAVTMDEALKKIADLFHARQHESAKMIVTPNPEMLLLAQKNPVFQKTLNSAYLSIPDGIGILWASTFHEWTKRNRNRFIILFKALLSLAALFFFPRACRRVFPERVTGVDLMERIVKLSPQFHAPIFLLGAEPGVAEIVQERFTHQYPGIYICGTYTGSPDEKDFPKIQEKIHQAKPAILFVAYGQKKQELWIARHLSEFPSLKIAMGVGGAFNFIAGVRKRAPRWMRRLGLEWMYRLMQEPKRFLRIYHAVVKFPLTVIAHRLTARPSDLSPRSSSPPAQ